MLTKDEIKKLEDYPRDKDGEWTRAMFPGDNPIRRLPDGTPYDENDPDHFSHPF